MGVFTLILSIINLVIILIHITGKGKFVIEERGNKASNASKDNNENASKKVAQASESELLFTKKFKKLEQSFTEKFKKLESNILQNLKKVSQSLEKHTNNNFDFYRIENELFGRVMKRIEPYLPKNNSQQSSSPEKQEDPPIDIDVPLEKEQDKTAGKENEHETGQTGARKGQFFYFGIPNRDSTFEDKTKKTKVDDECYYKFEILDDKAKVSLILDNDIKVQNCLRYKDTYLAICVFTHEANRTYNNIKQIKSGIFHKEGNIWRKDVSIKIEIS